MDHYQLAKLIACSGRLESRKRLQKVVFLLQVSGCPYTAEFTLHHYGPYSEELARLTDEMVRNSLLLETSSSNGFGQQYSYTLPPAVEEQLRVMEDTPEGRVRAAEIMPFAEKLTAYLAADLKKLEYASTIVYFRRQGFEWPIAVDKAATFKRTQAVLDALALAKTAIT